MVPSLCLQDFLLGARVLKLYRRSLRIARRAPDHARGLLVLRRKHYISPVKVSSPQDSEVEKNQDCRDMQGRDALDQRRAGEGEESRRDARYTGPLKWRSLSSEAYSFRDCHYT
ncbi:hypothetical protein SAY87_021953 [Trapa incisa]|uniref:Uncharacterized protein n=1 Tax=Trapa incisa TaxID=236973 RepID=A0AAN7PX31_9MYRT|nr:hypothetical protein SAY87_021953 [Trapa incisa]